MLNGRLIGKRSGKNDTFISALKVNFGSLSNVWILSIFEDIFIYFQNIILALIESLSICMDKNIISNDSKFS